MKICENCTGCSACYSICPFHAIQMVQNERGFYVPKIDEEKCTKCGMCIKTCPQNKSVCRENDYEVFASWNRDEECRSHSTSGGLFTLLAEEILNRDGIVFGAYFDENFVVKHGYIDNMSDLNKFRGSKYVQSDMKDTYRKVKEFLSEDKFVLFSGTPCQIAGLKCYLRKDYDKLILVDIVCHGVPSPKVFSEYLNTITNDVSNIKDIQFRYKKPSWTVFSMKIDFQDGTTYLADTNTDPYLLGFLEDYITNPTCSECHYTNLKRNSDITIADFWEYISEKKEFRNDEKGISLCIVNTPKGKEIFEKIKEFLVVISKDIEEAKKGNRCLYQPFHKNKLYDEFWKDYEVLNFSELSDKYFVKRKISFKRKISLFYNNHAYYIPKFIANFLDSLRSKLKARR